MAATTMSIVRPGTLHMKNVARTEEREKKAIGKMATSQIISYVCYRHRGMLLTTAFMFTNLYWIVRFYHQ